MAMVRKPKARQKIIDASRKIVLERGAGALTYDEISLVSGVTRGGITYHFPTKQALLQGLVEHDVRQWKQVETENQPEDAPAEAAELLGFIRAHTSEDPDHRRFVSGMLSAVTHDPPILDPARQFERERMDAIDWDEHALRLQLLRFAAIGLFWSELFCCPDLPKDTRRQLVALLEKMATDWTAAASADETSHTE